MLRRELFVYFFISANFVNLSDTIDLDFKKHIIFETW